MISTWLSVCTSPSQAENPLPQLLRVGLPVQAPRGERDGRVQICPVGSRASARKGLHSHRCLNGPEKRGLQVGGWKPGSELPVLVLGHVQTGFPCLPPPHSERLQRGVLSDTLLWVQWCPHICHHSLCRLPFCGVGGHGRSGEGEAQIGA